MVAAKYGLTSAGNVMKRMHVFFRVGREKSFGFVRQFSFAHGKHDGFSRGFILGMGRKTKKRVSKGSLSYALF